jgi:hypothetical protein
MVPRYTALARTGSTTTSRRGINSDMPSVNTHFTSQESYFPVFDTSVKELQKLEADVVQNVTAFYTYMKVTRDYLRKLADLHPPINGDIGDGDWHRAIANVIYMQFLGLESARKSIKDLVEFQPTRAEDIFIILLSELKAYAFLCRYFKDGLRQRALKTREVEYHDEVARLHDKVMKKTSAKWKRAKAVAEEAMNLYQEVFACEPTAPATSPQESLSYRDCRPALAPSAQSLVSHKPHGSVLANGLLSR